MGITNITWEEFETFEKVETPENLHIRKYKGSYYTFFELGIASVRRIFHVQTNDFNEYMSGRRSADDLRFKSQNDRWPPTEEERRESERRFILDGLTPLIANPKSQELFTREELEELIPIAEKNGLIGEGNYQIIMSAP